jgi:hypothetical protein
MSGVDDIRAQALEVAAGWSAPEAPASWQLTAALFRLIARHDELVDRLAELPPDRLPALLASAAISFLVRRDRPQPLASYFPDPGQPQPPFGAGFADAASGFVSARLEEILALCGRHRYQMNEVARSTQIACGLSAAGPAAEVALIDLGTGAGLGLQLDQYRYRFGSQLSGPAAATLTLHCQVRGERPPPAVMLPRIVARAGLELNPVDLADAAALDWLRACAPPEASALTRLTAAVSVARQHPARIVAGDVVDSLPGVLASMPPGLPVIVVDAYLAVFLPPLRLQALTEVLASAGQSRAVTWLSLDPLVPIGASGRDSVQGLDLPAELVAEYAEHGVFAVLGARTFDGSADAGRLLARAHPSGQWIEWLG